MIRRMRPAMLGTLAALALATPVAALPTETGCPSAYEVRTVAEWEALDSYRVPRQLDEAGNQDGIVCGLESPAGFYHGWAETANGFEPDVAVIYDFRDNRVPAKR